MTLCFVSCKDKDLVANEEDQAISFYNQIGFVNEEITDHLDYVFAASELLDSVKAGGNSDIVKNRYFYAASDVQCVPANNAVNVTFGLYLNLTIEGDGTPLTKTGSKWVVSGQRHRVWSSSSDPETVSFTFIVTNNGSNYSMSGNIVTNNLYEYYYTSITAALDFTVAKVTVYDSLTIGGGSDNRPVNQYTIDGEAYSMANIQMVEKIKSLVSSCPYELVEGERVYVGTYFTGGTVNSTFSSGSEKLTLDINYYPTYRTITFKDNVYKYTLSN